MLDYFKERNKILPFIPFDNTFQSKASDAINKIGNDIGI
jgi:hypothetical protein